MGEITCAEITPTALHTCATSDDSCILALGHCEVSSLDVAHRSDTQIGSAWDRCIAEGRFCEERSQR